MNALIYRFRTGYQWEHLPTEFGWEMSIWRTFRRWEQKGIFEIPWALFLIECEELGGVDWQWQAADGCLGKARGRCSKAVALLESAFDEVTSVLVLPKKYYRLLGTSHSQERLNEKIRRDRVIRIYPNRASCE